MFERERFILCRGKCSLSVILLYLLFALMSSAFHTSVCSSEQCFSHFSANAIATSQRARGVTVEKILEKFLDCEDFHELCTEEEFYRPSIEGGADQDCRVEEELSQQSDSDSDKLISSPPTPPPHLSQSLQGLP